MNNENYATIKNLVLIGGGHSHLFVLKHFAMHPIPGLKLTLITRDLHTPYSGMLPGYVAGHYTYDESHIDLRPLAQFTNARICHSEVDGIDLLEKKISCPGRPDICFDFLSINIGSRPGTLHIQGADEFSIPVKPIDHFLLKLENLTQKVLEHAMLNKPFHLAIVGAGAGGVEMALATQHRLKLLLQNENIADDCLSIDLFCDSEEILPSHNIQVRQRFVKVLKQREITVHYQNYIKAIDRTCLTNSNNQKFPADATLWVTNASAPAWLKNTGLALDDGGFIAVHDTLQSISDKNVFAAGDIAAVLNHPRPKSGVFAVRQGMPLAKNLANAVLNKSLKPHIPQINFLGLISTGDKYAVASRGEWSLQGVWLWKFKDWIDRKFMDEFNKIPEMFPISKIEIDDRLFDKTSLTEISTLSIRCGGCGSKIGAAILTDVIGRLNSVKRTDIIVGLNTREDAAVIDIPANSLLVQTVDHFRSFIDDPYIFGKITTNHALSDIFAMGAEAHSALALVTLPIGVGQQIEEQLYQIMSGVVSVLNESNTALIGGHSSEGAELSLGLSVNGLVSPNNIMRKSSMQTDDVIILSKALGTGTLFAADMRRKAKGRWIDSAIQSMLISNQMASKCFQRHGATACTDITGFGLVGHLVELTTASNKSIVIDISSLPLLDGVTESFNLGIFSSLQQQNQIVEKNINNYRNFMSHKNYPLLFDPQTSGGLAASVPAEKAEDCVNQLKEMGYSASAIIGNVIDNTGYGVNLKQ